MLLNTYYKNKENATIYLYIHHKVLHCFPIPGVSAHYINSHICLVLRQIKPRQLFSFNWFFEISKTMSMNKNPENIKAQKKNTFHTIIITSS